MSEEKDFLHVRGGEFDVSAGKCQSGRQQESRVFLILSVKLRFLLPKRLICSRIYSVDLFLSCEEKSFPRERTEA
jgi:hypothetical protein